jgi:hypothetical protein
MLFWASTFANLDHHWSEPTSEDSKVMLAWMVAGLLSVSAPARAAGTEGNVILVTLDGVRFQEFFYGVQMPERAGVPWQTPLFPNTWAAVRGNEAFIFGTERDHGKMWVGNSNGVSLPGYRSILSGEFEDRCSDNDCANIDRETVIDSLVDRGLPSEKVGAIASWDGIGRSLQSRSGKISRSVSFEGFPDVPLEDEERLSVDALAELARWDLPQWHGSRKDIYTYELGLRYINATRPRFFFWSFVDSDEYGHLNQYRAYTSSLLRYDRWIARLRRALERMGEYGDETSIVVTTDHGRYPGALWFTHGGKMGGGRRVWAVVFPSARILRENAVTARKSASYSHLDIRPTLETLLGIPSEASDQRSGQALIQIGPRARLKSR